MFQPKGPFKWNKEPIEMNTFSLLFLLYIYFLYTTEYSPKYFINHKKLKINHVFSFVDILSLSDQSIQTLKTN